MKKIQSTRGYRKDNVDEIQNSQVQLFTKRIFTLKNKLKQQNKEILQKINFGDEEGFNDIIDDLEDDGDAEQTITQDQNVRAINNLKMHKVNVLDNINRKSIS